MSGVWVFKNGVFRLVENPPAASEKVLVHVSTGEVITSYSSLERILRGLGWKRYYGDPEFLQFDKSSSNDLISLPKDFAKFRSVHMYDIVVKIPDLFRVCAM